jgi:GDP-L-fucose synthase
LKFKIPRDASVYVAGHRGMVGSAICRKLKSSGFENVIFSVYRTSRNVDKAWSRQGPPAGMTQQIDLRCQDAVNIWFEENRPEYVFLAAAKVGGILANARYPAQFIYDNLAIQTNVIHASYAFGVKRLLSLGSSCIYPRDCPQPIREQYLMNGKLEKTNEAYAIAKIVGLKMCHFYRQQYGCDFRSCMPTNLFGINDNFDLETSHVLPALIRKFHDAKVKGKHEVVVWGTGAPRREFLSVDDFADACLFLMEKDSNDWERIVGEDGFLNVGTGQDVSIRELAEIVRMVVYPGATLTWDTSKPDGTPRKLLDVSVLDSLGWKVHTTLEEGIRNTYRWYQKCLSEDERCE